MNRKGFSVLEVVIALALSVLVFGGLFSLLRTGSTFCARSAERGDPREAAHLALSRAALALADSWSYAVDASGETVRFRGAPGAGELAFRSGRVDLTVGRDAQTLIGSGVRSFSVRELSRGLLRFELELARNPVADPADAAPCRVIHEARVPAVADRDPLLPLRPVFDLTAAN